jgi:hypothetical protein
VFSAPKFKVRSSKFEEVIFELSTLNFPAFRRQRRRSSDHRALHIRIHERVKQRRAVHPPEHAYIQPPQGFFRALYY